MYTGLPCERSLGFIVSEVIILRRVAFYLPFLVMPGSRHLI